MFSALKFHISLLNIYFRLSGIQSMLVIIYFYNGLNRFSNTLLKLHQSVVQNLYDMWCSNFEICMAQLHCTVTEITALNCCSCVNRSPVQHDFRGSAKLFSIATVNIHRSLPCNFWEFFLGFFDNIYHDNTCRSLYWNCIVDGFPELKHCYYCSSSSSSYYY